MTGLRTVMTDRLRLDAISLSDAELLFPIFGDATGWWYDPHGRHGDIDRTREWVEKAAARWESDGLSYWAVRLTDSGETVGVGGVQRRQSRSWNLYYRVATSHWARGYATELAHAAIAAAHDTDDEVSVGAWIAEHNHPSRRVAERIGLVNYGAFIDVNDGELRLVYADRLPDEAAHR